MTDKWTVGSNKEGLYNGTNPPKKKKKEREEEKRKKRKKGGDQESEDSSIERTQPKGIHLVPDPTPRI